MQHLDEGTVHSWLDGALSPEEAARVEAHVKECPQCAGAVAEARGFIAASSRILTALDNAPRGVIPAAAPKRRIDPLVWRIAAALLVVAGGTLIVVQDRGSKREVMSSAVTDSNVTSQLASVPEKAGAAIETAPAIADQVAAEKPLNKAPATALAAKGATGGSGGSKQAETRAYQQLSDGRSRDEGRAAAREGAAAAVPRPQAPALPPPSVAGVVALDAAEPEQLKVVGTPRRIGAKVTLYEVAPGDTVTLTESGPSVLQGVVVTGAAAAAPQTARRMAAQSPTRTDAAVSAGEKQAAANAPSPAAAALAPPPPAAFRVASAVNAITWKDPATGATLTLSGRMPVERLQDIKIRIERERAAATPKKNP
jgi:anti-sigma factor RsiW